MRKISFFVLDAFTETRFAGNPAGVVLHKEELTESEMRSIARELSLETAFVAPSEIAAADYRVAYFTGARRIPLCGHDTIALTTALHQTNRLAAPGKIRLATDVGILSVEIDDDGIVTMAQATPIFGQCVSADACADALGLTRSALADLPVQIVSTGTPFVFLPVTRLAVLDTLAPDMPRLASFLDSLCTDDLRVDGLFAWSRETHNPQAAVSARCFCPGTGLSEDPVTGTASGALGAYLSQQKILTPNSAGEIVFDTEQGVIMGRPGAVRVTVKTETGKTMRVSVTGRAVMVAEGVLWME